MISGGGDPWRLRFGSTVQRGAGVSFRVWAPHLEELRVTLLGDRQSTFSLTRSGEDFYIVIPNLQAGVDYEFVTAEERRYADPVSRWQPYGVHGASRVVDPDSFPWSDGDWTGIALADLLIYELHTGTFTPEGTFEAIIPRIPYLRELGITAIELMPVAEFPGPRNWGYDGVCLYAPHTCYGGPAGLKTLVNACHRQGLAVVLDVVYNHVGPEGNYLGVFAPFFTQAYRTPWGEAINFDGPGSSGVRRFFIDNALYWVTEYHIDALRLDAVHRIFDFGALHLLEELAAAVHRQASFLGRRVEVIAESDLNDVRIIRPQAEGGYGLDAQWLDEFHHSLRTVLMESRAGFLGDFGKMSDLGKAITEGFVHDGNYSNYRRRFYGSSSKERPGSQFVAFIQDHDQIANTSQGSRLASLVTFEQQKLAAAVLLCSPYVPLLFMGQEYGEISPFYYFTSFDDPALGQAVREGRRKEFTAFAGGHLFADPQVVATFLQSKLDWARLANHRHSAMLRFYRDLIALRKRVPCLANCRKDLVRVTSSEEGNWIVVNRGDPSSSRAMLVCNFACCEQQVPVPSDTNNWILEFWTGSSLYGGPEGQDAPPSRAGSDASLLALGPAQAALYTSAG